MESDNSGSPPLATLTVTNVGEFVRFESCERRAKLALNRKSLDEELPFAERLFNPLDPVLREEGRKREDRWDQTLRDNGLRKFSGPAVGEEGDNEDPSGADGSDDHPSFKDFREEFATLSQGQRGYGREVPIEGRIGAFEIGGRMDFLIVRWDDGRPILRVVECKSSRKDRTYHRVQVAIYLMLVRQHLVNEPLQIGNFTINEDNVQERTECVVARIDETTNENQRILELEPLDTERLEADVDRLLSEDGPFARVVRTDLENLDYQLGPKCDGCVFNVHCFPESARRRKLHLIGIDPSNIRALQRVGVHTIDDLAELDDQEAISQLRRDQEFTESIVDLIQRAAVRRVTLPPRENDTGEAVDPDAYEVERRTTQATSQLPEHEIQGDRLIRVYMSVNYDYVENRIGALAAHVTRSEGQLYTGFNETDEGWRPDPQVSEQLVERNEDGGYDVVGSQGLQGEEVVQWKRTPWSGDSSADDASERELIQSFFGDVVDAIARVAESEEVRLHFYVWSRSDMQQLMEACSRAGSSLLANLRQLLGCRESLEQLIFSSLRDEVTSRFTMAWTSRGLVVATSLQWFGQTYHWNRRVAGKEIRLDRILEQDIFDFKTDLGLTGDGEWAESREEAEDSHKFEIRARFFDSLPAPYWRAVWRDLPDPETVQDTKTANAIERYQRIAEPNLLREYLTARTHALRWIEERVRFKNDEIEKPRLEVTGLPSFNLNVDNTARAAIDFLRLDHSVKVTEWVSRNLTPPIHRVTNGRTIPVRDLTVVDIDDRRLQGAIDLDGYAITREVLSTRCSMDEGTFVRFSPCFEDPERSQTISQLTTAIGGTCQIEELDWDTGRIVLGMRGGSGNNAGHLYRMPSRGISDTGPYSVNEGDVILEHATLERGLTDFVSSKVDNHLQSTNRSHHAYDWFNPTSPAIPIREEVSDTDVEAYRDLLESFRFPGGGYRLTDEQIDSCLDGLNTRIQLLLGPPGTGKTATTSIALLLRILARYDEGTLVFVSGPTHTAVNTLLEQLAEVNAAFHQDVAERGLEMPNVRIAKVHSSEVIEEQRPENPEILNFEAVSKWQSDIEPALDESVLVAGATPSTMLKLARYLDRLTTPDHPPVPVLVVDEASMMVFPHFLALATLVEEDGEIMLAGDHRQLAPITAHDWEDEDRPPVEVYRPFVSAYEAVRRLRQDEESDLSDQMMCQSELSYTHRLPAAVRSVVGQLYRDLDDVELEGAPFEDDEIPDEESEDPLAVILGGPSRLCLLRHSERSSRQSNELEAELIRRILEASPTSLDDNSIAVVTPHRAQRSLLRDRLSDFSDAIRMVETVEKVQGAGIPIVIVSATVSDPTAISKRAEFLLDLNRANVAFSRSEDRLVVVSSSTLMDHLPVELDQYESSMLWKIVRDFCSVRRASLNFDGEVVEVLTPSRGELQSIG
jgi:hypothetical protein